MQFKDIIGQNELKNKLREAAREGRVPHALLFSGQSGVGKLPMALAFAQYMACPNRTEEDSCGCCPACLQYGKLQHPDLHFAYPLAKKEGQTGAPVADDYAQEWRTLVLDTPYFNLDDWYEAQGVQNKQGQIFERESSEILRKLSLKSFSNGYKTMIIWLPERMNEVCANKLLKIIEEPPTKTVFILVSEEPQRLLATILSRVQEVRFDRLDEQTIAGALREVNSDLSVSESFDYAHMANGSYLAALKYMQNSGQTSVFFEWFVSLMRAAWSVGHRKDYDQLLFLKRWSTDKEYTVKTPEGPVTHKSIIDAGREKQKAFLEYAIRQVRENYISNFNQPEIIYQTQDEKQFSTRFAPFINENNIEGLIELFSTALRQIEQNGNAKIVFFDLCLQLIVLIK